MKTKLFYSQLYKPKFKAKKMYLIDPNKLQPGDIILTRSSDEISTLVRKRSNSQYSHAILYVGVTSCIESDGLGVQSENIQRILIENKDDAKVLRLKDWNESTADNATVFARQKIGTAYSLAEARLATLKKQIEAKEPNRQYCTRFVAQAYEYAGLNLVDNPNYCTPEDLLKSDKLYAIDDALKEANKAEVEFAHSKNPLEEQAKIHNYIFENSQMVSGQDIQTFDQLAQYVLDNPDKESEITKIIKESGYLTMWQLDTEACPWHYDSKLLIEHYKHPQQILEVATFFGTTESETRSRFEMTLEALKQGYSFFKQEYFMVLIELYEKLIQLSYQREKVALQIIKGR